MIALDVLAGGLAVVLGLALVMAGWRMVRGPSLADRFIALDMLTALAVGFVGLTAVATGRGEFLDIGLGLALINFAIDEIANPRLRTGGMLLRWAGLIRRGEGKL